MEENPSKNRKESQAGLKENQTATISYLSIFQYVSHLRRGLLPVPRRTRRPARLSCAIFRFTEDTLAHILNIRNTEARFCRPQGRCTRRDLSALRQLESSYDCVRPLSQCEACAVDAYGLSPLTGTIFDNTNKPLENSSRAADLMPVSRKGMSALQSTCSWASVLSHKRRGPQCAKTTSEARGRRTTPAGPAIEARRNPAACEP